MALQLLKSNKLGHTFKPLHMYSHTGEYIKDGVLTTNGSKWRTRRRLLSTTMSTSSISKYVKSVNNHCKLLVNDLQQLFKDEQTHDEVNDLIGGCVVAVTCEMITGVPIKNMEECLEHHRQFKKFGVEPHMQFHKPWLLFSLLIKQYHLHTERAKILKHTNAFFDRRLKEIHEKRSRTKNDKENMNRGMLDVLIDNHISDEEIVFEAKTLLVAGYETVAFAMNFILWMIALHPEHQELCRQEVNDVCKLMENSSPTFSVEHVQKMKYLEMCILEALRLYPVPHLPSRYLDEPWVFDYNGEEKELPKGTIVTMSLLSMHRNGSDYPNPDKFDPNRFSPEQIAQHGPPPFLAFSGGIRGCLGRTFAMNEMKIIVAYLLRHFEWTTKDNLSDVKILLGFNLTLKRDINYKFVPRANTY